MPETSPQDEATTELVGRLRGSVLPAAVEGTGLDPAVSGSVAISVDFSDYLAERLPYFLGAVLALSFLLLMVVFRSVLVPLKAVVIKLMGTGLATAILLDATIVRMILVPATMELLGDRNWWVPRWLDRILPRVEIDGHRADEPGDGPTPAPAAADDDRHAGSDREQELEKV